MPIDILHISDTIEQQMLPGYFDQIGVSAYLADFDYPRAQMLIFSRHPVTPQIPMDYCGDIQFFNLLHPRFNYPHPPLCVQISLEYIKDHQPQIITLPHTMRGCQIAANIAVHIDAALVSGVDRIMVENGRLVLGRAVMNGKWTAHMLSQSPCTVFTINQGAFSNSSSEYGNADDALLTRINLASSLDDMTYVTTGMQPSDSADYPLEAAEVVVAAGRGLQTEENLSLIHDMVAIFKNAAMGASRPLCDLGWVPYSHQVGETGKQVTPKLYIACGISGANQHIAGMRQSQAIMAINPDPQAAIFRVADFGIIEKVEELIPVVLERWDDKKQR